MAITRRASLAALTAVVGALLFGCTPASTDTAPTKSSPPTKGAFAELEERFGARLGVYAVDTGSGRTVAYHGDERFAYASTYKALAAAAVVKKNSPAGLDRVVHYTRDDLVDYSPITGKEENLRGGMTLRALCEAAVGYSDNTAGNLLFNDLHGPQGFQNALRALGDDTTQADRHETALNDFTPGDLRDTSTPRALAADLRAYTLGDALAPEGRALVTDWLKHNTTGGNLIRAGVPADWQVGDKTGAASYGTRNDIAIAWPPNRAPVIIAILSHRDTKDAPYDDQLIAAAAKDVVASLT